MFGIPDFKYFAHGDGISAIFTRSPGEINNLLTEKINPAQLDMDTKKWGNFNLIKTLDI